MHNTEEQNMKAFKVLFKIEETYEGLQQWRIELEDGTRQNATKQEISDMLDSVALQG